MNILKVPQELLQKWNCYILVLKAMQLQIHLLDERKDV